ncbi:hypothetical protein D3C81_1366870 [compost metagenome]
MTVDSHLTAGHRVDPGNGTDHLATPGADHTGDSKNFTGAHRERDVLKTLAAAGQVTHRQHFSGKGRCDHREQPFDRTADHLCHQHAHLNICLSVMGDQVAVTHDHDAVSNTADFFHSVANVDERNAFALERLDLLE